LRVDRPAGQSFSPAGDSLTRHKTSISLDLKDRRSRDLLLAIIAKVDVLIDPFRPGVLERLGLSPADVLLKANPRLIVARMAGFRRDGKYKDMAGHDINYLAVSGVLSMLKQRGQRPYPPGNILADFAGGGATCFIGILLALITRHVTGRGQVVEANMVDGSAYLATMPRLAQLDPSSESILLDLLDGSCPWYNTYETKDAGKYFAVGALEPQFYSALVEGLGLVESRLPSRADRANWPAIGRIFANRFREKTRAEWEAIFDGTDACATPILEQTELHEGRYEQRHIVGLVDTPGKPLSSDDGGWTGGRLSPGEGGESTLNSWFGWQRGVEYDGHDGVLVKVKGSSPKL
jgi:alpha-methylacyl-CoA racemase